MPAARRRRRDGLLWLVAGFAVLDLTSLLSLVTGTWRFLLVAAPLFMLSFALGLILLGQPAPRDTAPTDRTDEPNDAKRMPARKSDGR